MSEMVTVRNRQFRRGNSTFRFAGANMYELAYTEPEIALKMLTNAAEEGFTVVRFWAFTSVSMENFASVRRFAEMLGILLIPVLGDMNEFLQGFAADDEFFRKGYKERYLPFARDLAQRFKDDPQILAWEIFNEPRVSQFRLIFEFAETVSGSLKDSGARQIVSIGTIGGIGDKFGSEFSRFNHRNFYRLYSIESLDAVSIHDYSLCSSLAERADLYFRMKSKYVASAAFNKLDKFLNALPDALDVFCTDKFSKTFSFPLSLRSIWRMYNEIDIAYARLLGKPVYAGETGIKKKYGNKRSMILEAEMLRIYKSGVSGILLWSFETENKSLDGHDYGFNENDHFGETARKTLSVFNADYRI